MKPQIPRPYEEWRADPVDREEDAAHAFGYYVIRHCRAEALKKQPDAVKAVDTALHNVFDLLEGFFPTKVGEKYPVEFVLSVRVRDPQTGQGWVDDQYSNPILAKDVTSDTFCEKNRTQ